MFDARGVAPEALELVRAGTRGEAQSAASRLTGAWRFVQACLRSFPDEDLALVDTYDAIAAEIGASVGRSYRYGHTLIEYGAAMHERLPLTGALLAAGDISLFLFQTIVYRTALITDPDRVAEVDAAIAGVASGWTGYSRSRLGTAVDAIVAAHDPDAVRRKAEDRAQDVGVEITDHEAGFAGIYATVFAPTGAALDARLDALADTVCSRDGRSKGRRRADGIDALIAGLDRLPCQCERPDCPAAAAGKKAGDTVIYLVGEHAPTDPTTPPRPNDPGPDSDPGSGDGPNPEPEPDSDPGPDPGPPAPPAWRPGFLFGSDELIPSAVMVDIAASATVVTVRHPGAHSPPECRYRPSRATRDFVRARDLTCRAPGCDVPATKCEIDHTVPYDDGGPTHPSNLKCLCVFHHLLKTYWGWYDEQRPDGTVYWRTPAGHTYTTYPGSMLIYPQLCAPTATLDLPLRHTWQRPRPDHPNMPKRKHTRAENRAARIHAERHHNRTDREARKRILDEQLDTDPPPF